MTPDEYFNDHLPHRVNLLTTFRERYASNPARSGFQSGEPRDLFRCSKDISMLMVRFFCGEMGLYLPRRGKGKKGGTELEEVTGWTFPFGIQQFTEAEAEGALEILDVRPMRFIKRRIVRPRYLRKDERSAAPVCAPLPPRVLAGGLPGVDLLVQVILAKYMDHLPLYRQERIFRQRYGVRVSRKTMSDWIRAVSEDWLGLKNWKQRQAPS